CSPARLGAGPPARVAECALPGKAQDLPGAGQRGPCEVARPAALEEGRAVSLPSRNGAALADRGALGGSEAVRAGVEHGHVGLPMAGAESRPFLGGPVPHRTRRWALAILRGVLVPGATRLGRVRRNRARRRPGSTW